MDLKEYFADCRVGLPMDDESGVESDWLLLCTMAIPNGVLWVGDPYFAWAEPPQSCADRSGDPRLLQHAVHRDHQGTRKRLPPTC